MSAKWIIIIKAAKNYLFYESQIEEWRGTDWKKKWKAKLENTTENNIKEEEALNTKRWNKKVQKFFVQKEIQQWGKSC